MLSWKDKELQAGTLKRGHSEAASLGVQSVLLASIYCYERANT